MIKAKNIHDMNHVKMILDKIRDYINAYEQIGNLSEDALDKVTFQLCEIEEFIIGNQECNVTNLVNADIRLMTYWDYINDKICFWDMIGELKKYEGEV